MGKTKRQAGAPKEQDKGKGIATSSNPKTKKKKSAKGPKETTRERGVEYPPGSSECLEKFTAMKLEQTKFVDPEILAQLGIYEDVMTIFRNMGLEKFMQMREISQQYLTCQFLSSLEVRFFEENKSRHRVEFEKYGRGYIHFTIGRRSFQVTLQELNEIFGFEDEGTTNDKHFVYPLGELNRIWNTIASGSYEPGASRIAAVRNPAIHYVLKALVHVFYAKIEVDTISSEEMEFLGLGLKPLFPNLADGGEFFGIERKPGLATILARSLMEYKTWAYKTKAKRAFIGIGWIATAIMRAKAKEVSLAPVELPLMDEKYLSKTKFVKRHNGNNFAYTFYPTDSTQARVLLPNPQLTRLDTLVNATFNPPQEFYIENLHEEVPEPARGSARYDFNPYTGPMNTAAATAAAHEQNKLLQKMVKWQQRTIEKMAGTIKGMKRTIKNMGKTIQELRCRGNDGEAPMETEFGSTSHLASGDKGKRKARSQTPTSSNESLSLGTESSSPSPSD